MKKQGASGVGLGKRRGRHEGSRETGAGGLSGLWPWVTVLAGLSIGAVVAFAFIRLTGVANRPAAERAATREARAKGAAQTYPLTVKEGEDLLAVSRHWDVSTNELMALNNLTSLTLKAGTVLQIPYAPGADGRYNGATTAYTVKEGEDLYAVAIRWGVSPSELKNLNNLTSTELPMGKVLLIPSTP